MSNKYFFVSFFVMVVMALSACSDKSVVNHADTLASDSMDKSKVWAHRVNTPEEANKKIKFFEGVEVDLVFDTSSGEIYVSHEIDHHTLWTFREYLRHVTNPEKPYYWLDVKNLDANVEAICDSINSLAVDFGFQNRFFVESWHAYALRTAKEKGIQTSLWVDNIFERENPDTLEWRDKVANAIEIARPDAISAEYRMRQLMVNYFPEMSVNLWQTPAECTPENVEMTREICRDSHVKVVLVDYEKPSI